MPPTALFDSTWTDSFSGLKFLDDALSFKTRMSGRPPIRLRREKLNGLEFCAKMNEGQMSRMAKAVARCEELTCSSWSYLLTETNEGVVMRVEGSPAERGQANEPHERAPTATHPRNPSGTQ